jgi:p-aminobenzoyl-glutamate transporter AbgT
MKFPKVASVDLSQLPTDSSELTPQESYIFSTIFQPEIDAYNQLKNQSQNNNTNMQQLQSNQQPQLKEHLSKKSSKNMSVKTRMLLSLMFVVLIVIFSITPIPNTIGSMMKNSPLYFGLIVLILFVLSFMLFTRYIKL